jgi:hypothetical protein
MRYQTGTFTAYAPLSIVDELALLIKPEQRSISLRGS